MFRNYFLSFLNQTMRSHLKFLSLRLSVLFALVTITIFWLTSTLTKDLQLERPSGNFYSVNILKRVYGNISPRTETIGNRPATTDEGDLSVEVWKKLVEKGAELVRNMKSTSSKLAQQPGINGKSKSIFQVSVHSIFRLLDLT